VNVLAIDPGPLESAYAVVDSECAPIVFGKVPNIELLDALPELAQLSSRGAIEMIASYGMAVGADVFETCVWIGRFAQVLDQERLITERVKRNPIKVHHCHSSKANDSNIRQALVDRFAYGQPNHGKGTKSAPGWFHGFHSDIWAAYALAVYVADTARSAAADEVTR
jgi:uncharacterized protein YlaI